MSITASSSVLQPRPFEKYSDEFNILGYLGQWQVQEQCTLMDTHSYPGHLMLKLLGPGLGTGFGAAGGSSLKLSDYPPPWEIETSFIAPDDSIPWNYWMNFIVVDKQGRNRGCGRRASRMTPRPDGTGRSPARAFKLHFDPEVPESILSHKPLGMLIQCIDDSHVRLGFRAGPGEPWHLSAGLRREKSAWCGDRRLRHALLEHNDGTHVRGRAGRTDVSEVPGRLRSLPLRAFRRLHAEVDKIVGGAPGSTYLCVCGRWFCTARMGRPARFLCK